MLDKLKTAIWTETRHLKVGDRIAVRPAADGAEKRSDLNESGLEFEEITSIKPLGRQQVYDIEVDGTHNFVANNILAHNTLVTGASYFANGTTYYVDASGNAKFLDLIVTDATNPGLTLGNATSGHLRISTQTISANATGIGIGTASPASKLVVSTGSGNAFAASGASGAVSATATAGPAIYAYGSTYDIYAYSGNNNYFAGNVGIGTTNPTQKLEVNGRIRMNTWTADGDTVAYRDTATNSLALVTSDRRLKKNITPLTGSLNIVNQINTYRYNDLDEADGSKLRLGVMSQELLSIIPELTFAFTNKNSSETYYGVHYDKLGVLLLGAIKELNQKVETLSQDLSTNFQAGIAVIQDLTVDTLTVKQKLISPVAYIEDLEVKNLVAETITAPQISQIEKDLLDLTAKYSTASAILSDLQANLASGVQPPIEVEPQVIITDDLQVNNSLITNLINSKDQDTLFLQPLANAPINLLAGLMTLTPNGQVIINGDLAVTGKVLASKIEALESNLENLTSKTATISSLTITSLTVQAEPPSSTASAQTPLDGSKASYPTGAATLPAGETEITISNTNVTQDTYIYLTPTSSTSNQTLFVKSKQDGQFTIAIPEAINSNIQFNYWLIQTI